MILLLIKHYLKMSIKYKTAAVVAIAYAVLLAFSRLYVGVHYPTDVIAGIVLGIATSFISLNGVGAVNLIGTIIFNFVLFFLVAPYLTMFQNRCIAAEAYSSIG